MLEPEVVLPTRFGRKLRNSFGTIVSVGRSGNHSDFDVNWPQYWKTVSNQTSNRDGTKVAMVAGNKLSFIPGEQYSLRRECAFEIPEISLFGTDWDSSKKVRFRKLVIEVISAIRMGYFPRLASAKWWFKKNADWQGAPTNKAQTLELFKFSLVIENSSEYLTEKIFDSFFAGCIPIYVGPSLKQYGIPDSLAIAVLPEIASIRNGIKRAQDLNYQVWHNDLSKWISSTKVKSDWEVENVITKIRNSIIG
jgi:hypothetical protein